MKKSKKIACIFFFLLFLITIMPFFSASMEAKTFALPEVYIEAEIHPDGSLQVQEQWTVEFLGKASGFFRWLPLEPPLSIVDISVSEEGEPYKFNPGAHHGPAGTFFVKEKEDEVLVDWSFEAQEEERTFTLAYRLENLIKVHDDVAELYYKFIGDEIEEEIGRAYVKLSLPQGAEREEIRAWGHGPLHGQVDIQDQETVVWEVKRHPPRTFLEGRVVFPPDLVPMSQRRTGQIGLPSILEEEEALVEETHTLAQRRQQDIFQAAAFLLIAVGLIFWLWRKNKPRGNFFRGKYHRELPDEYSPAELGVLWRGGEPGLADFTATIIDLARKGFITIEEQEKKARGLLRINKEKDYVLQKTQKIEGLSGHEKQVLDFLFETIAQENEDKVSFQDIKDYAKKHKKDLRLFWRDWKKSLKQRGEELSFFDGDSVMRRNIGLASGVIFMIGAILPFLLDFVVTGFSLLLGGFLIIICMALIPIRSSNGQDQYLRWRSFRRFLLHFSQMQRQEIPALILWEHYLVYAISLGVAKKVLDKLDTIYPQLQEDTHTFGYSWLFLAGSTQGNPVQGLNSLTSSVHEVFSQAFSTPASSSGTGGGFTGGGGGGAGGGGVGVR